MKVFNFIFSQIFFNRGSLSIFNAFYFSNVDFLDIFFSLESIEIIKLEFEIVK